MNKIGSIICFFLLGNFLFSQEILSDISKDSIKIGQPITMNILVEKKENRTVQFPELQDTLNTYFEITENKIDTVELNQKIYLRNQIQFTSFESGDFLLKTLPVKIDNKTLRTKGFLIHIEQVALEADQNKFVDIKPILEEELTLLDYWQKYWIYIVVAALSILLITVILILYLKSKRKKNSSIIPKTPYEEAIHLLKILDSKKYIEKGKLKAFYSELSFILRKYIGSRYEFNALKFLSDELVHFMKEKEELNDSDLEKLSIFLKDSDSVKFAKAKPQEFKHKEYRQFVESLIEKTKPVIVDEENEHLNPRNTN